MGDDADWTSYDSDGGGVGLADAPEDTSEGDVDASYGGGGDAEADASYDDGRTPDASYDDGSGDDGGSPDASYDGGSGDDGGSPDASYDGGSGDGAGSPDAPYDDGSGDDGGSPDASYDDGSGDGADSSPDAASDDGVTAGSPVPDDGDTTDDAVAAQTDYASSALASDAGDGADADASLSGFSVPKSWAEQKGEELFGDRDYMLKVMSGQAQIRSPEDAKKIGGALKDIKDSASWSGMIKNLAGPVLTQFQGNEQISGQTQSMGYIHGLMAAATGQPPPEFGPDVSIGSHAADRAKDYADGVARAQQDLQDPQKYNQLMAYVGAHGEDAAFDELLKQTGGHERALRARSSFGWPRQSQ